MRMRRAVGYCEGVRCEQYGKGVFLLNQTTFKCSKCHQSGKVVHEEGNFENKDRLIKEVQVSFDYNPELDKYATIAIVRDDSLVEDHNTYHYFSPMVKTEKRAFVLAERILGSLNQQGKLPSDGSGALMRENLLTWDETRELFRANCNAYFETLRGTPLNA
jgi:hypothetical protein